MKSAISYDILSTFSTELLAVFAVDQNTSKDKEATPEIVLLSTDEALAAAAKAVLEGGEFKASANETLLVHAPAGLAAKRLLIIGLGKAAKVTVHDVRKGAGTAVRFAKPRTIRELAIAVPDLEPTATLLPPGPCVRAVAEGALIADFDPDTYRSDRKDQSIQSFTVLSAGSVDAAAAEAAFREGTILAESQNFTRTLVNEPGNRMTPTVLGYRAKEMATEFGLECAVYGANKLQELKMGAFWAVAQGSDEPPALIVITYDPLTSLEDVALDAPADVALDAPVADKVLPDGEAAADLKADPVTVEQAVAKGPVLGLVGKGITFDTGGISIKPADGMEKMKYDMAGGAAMIGAMRAIAQLKPKVKVICVVCAAENMPSAKAYKPGDIVTAKSGKTIEVMNTDAEGRMVLADGLNYAKELGATHLIDAATLTGAVVVALGVVNAGVFSNDEDSYQHFTEALKISGDRFWRLPIEDEYREQIKSGIADIMNTGGSRWGGAITAAMFLKEFVDETPWIHLDIAGVAWNDDAKPWSAKGPTGTPVRSLVEWVKSYGV